MQSPLACCDTVKWVLPLSGIGSTSKKEKRARKSSFVSHPDFYFNHRSHLSSIFSKKWEDGLRAPSWPPPLSHSFSRAWGSGLEWIAASPCSPLPPSLPPWVGATAACVRNREQNGFSCLLNYYYNFLFRLERFRTLLRDLVVDHSARLGIRAQPPLLHLKG